MAGVDLNGEGKHNGKNRLQLRGRTPSSGRRRDRGDNRRPAFL